MSIVLTASMGAIFLSWLSGYGMGHVFLMIKKYRQLL